ncbi:MAG: hypothetical protein ACOY4T_15610 [Pseudomonadota bacterium]
MGGGTSTPLFPFDYPSHALLLIAFGGVFWTVATAVRAIAYRKDDVVDMSRHNPWFVLFKGRKMTPDEAAARLPPLFFILYGGLGRIFQWIGLAIVSFGTIGLFVSLIRKFL